MRRLKTRADVRRSGVLAVATANPHRALHSMRRLRPEDVVPPFITPEIGVYQNNVLKQHICSSMAKHRGRCVDAFLAFNGPDGSEDAYAKGWLTKDPCCYPSGKGQQVMAELLFKTGLKPLR